MSLQICFFGLAALDPSISELLLFPLLEELKWRSTVPHANVIDECQRKRAVFVRLYSQSFRKDDSFHSHPPWQS
eukprot:s644_g18.t1